MKEDYSTTPAHATTLVLRQLRELEAVQANGAQISGQAPRVYDAAGAASFGMLPPADEDAKIAERIAAYKVWLARHAGWL